MNDSLGKKFYREKTFIPSTGRLQRAAKNTKKHANYICECCGLQFSRNTKQLLNAHHTLPKHQFKHLGEIEAFMISVCEDCHDKLHSLLVRDTAGVEIYARIVTEILKQRKVDVSELFLKHLKEYEFEDLDKLKAYFKCYIPNI